MITMSVDLSQFKLKLAEVKTVTDKAMPQIYTEFVKNTPIGLTGNARAHTNLNGKVITAAYQYAGVLDAGRGYRDGQMRGSDQAPNGMTQPTEEFAKKLIPQIVQQIANRRTK